jgi:hypothetical protein
VEPTTEQLRTFYRVTRQSVLMYSFIAFVELGEEGNLYIYVGRYDNTQDTFLVTITPTGELKDD